MRLLFCVLWLSLVSVEVLGFDMRRFFHEKSSKKRPSRYSYSSPPIQLLSVPQQSPIQYAIQSQPVQYVIRDPTPQQIIVREPTPQQIIVKEPEIQYIKQKDPVECPKPEVETKFIPIYLPQPMIPPISTPSSSYGVPKASPISSSYGVPLSSPQAASSFFSSPYNSLNSFSDLNFGKLNSFSKGSFSDFSNYFPPTTSSFSAPVHTNNYPPYTTFTRSTVTETGQPSIPSPPATFKTHGSRRKRSMDQISQLYKDNNDTRLTIPFLDSYEASLMLSFSKFSFRDTLGYCTAKVICNLISTPVNRLEMDQKIILKAIRSPQEYLFGVSKQNGVSISAEECNQLYRRCHLTVKDIMRIIRESRVSATV